MSPPITRFKIQPRCSTPPFCCILQHSPSSSSYPFQFPRLSFQKDERALPTNIHSSKVSVSPQ
jgi:hypothetical protein